MAIGTEFGSRHALHERNFFGNHENIRTERVQVAEMVGQTAQHQGFAEQCLVEHDLNGWTVSDPIDPGDISIVVKDVR